MFDSDPDYDTPSMFTSSDRIDAGDSNVMNEHKDLNAIVALGMSRT